MNPEDNNPVQELVNKRVRLPFAAIAIILMLGLTLNGLLININNLKADYVSIIADQEIQLATVMSSQKRKTVVENEVNNIAPKETNRIIVKYKDNAKLPPGLTIAAERANLEKAQGLVKVLTIAGINADVYQVSENDSAQEVVDRILSAKGDMIEYAEVDMLVAPDYIPNDPNLGSAWHINNVMATTAWDSAQGEGVVVAIADTGVDCNHVDLAASCIPGWNTATNSADTTDINGHGTKVAGTAAQIGDNAIGSAGIAYKAKIMPMRVTDSSDGYAYFSAIASAFTWAADHGAKVAQASYSGCGSASIINAGAYLRSKGGVATISAGNSGADSGFAQSDKLVCVSATGSNDLRTSWSSFGQYVDVAAPGDGIYTTARGGGYASVSGTSFSGPLTTGIYALMFSVNPKLTPNQADNILFSTADDIGEPGWDMYYGYGRVNAAKAVASAKAAIGTQDIVPPSTPTNLSVTSVGSNNISLAWTASTDDNTGVASYDIFENNTKISSVAGVTYTRTGLTPTTVYNYTVKAVDGAGNVSNASNLVTATTTDIAFGISSYSVSTKTTTGATVITTLTKPGTITVKYGKTASSLTSIAQGTTQGTTHSVSLSGLTAKTTYYYQVVATDSSGTVVSSRVSSFKTAAGGGRR
jgi:thermitase